MKKFFLLFLIVALTSVSLVAERTSAHMQTHQTGSHGEDLERDRNPIDLPIKVYYDSDTNIVEVWCDNDNIYGEVFVYDETGALEVYSAYMNVSLPLSTTGHHSILIKGDGWESIGDF